MKYTFFNDDALERVTSGYLSVEDRAVFYGDGTQEIQVKVSYPNQYGISCIKSPCSYGEQYDLWEVAILFGDDQCCDTYITNDVCGYATDEDVARIAEMVRDLVDEDEDFLAEIELLYGNSPPSGPALAPHGAPTTGTTTTTMKKTTKSNLRQSTTSSSRLAPSMTISARPARRS